MSMFDGILGNVDELAAKFGVPADQVKPMMEAFGAKLAAGGDHVSAMSDVAAAHGIPMEKVNEVIAHLGGSDGLMGKAIGMLDRDGDGNPVNELSNLAKGLFG